MRRNKRKSVTERSAGGRYCSQSFEKKS